MGTAPSGTSSPGAASSASSESGEIAVGQMRLVPLGPGEKARITVEPARGFDCGAGSGKRVEKEIRGGTVGLVLDGRGRPLVCPERPPSAAGC